MLKRGDRGPQVEALQQALVNLGFMSEAQMASGPGIYGPKTEASVRAYKQEQMDGIADDHTLRKLGLQPVPVAEQPSPADEDTSMVNAVVDLSHHNGTPDFQKAREDGLIGVIHKATQGLRFIDSMYRINREKAREAGLLWGAYHFATGDDPVAQAEHFLRVAKPDGETLLVLDFEKNPSGTSMALDGAIEFVSHVARKTGTFPGLYSGNDIKEQLGNDHNPSLAQCWFWLAQYGPRAVVPPNWSSWTMWQYTDGNLGPEPHEVAGIGPCDRDKFQGSREALIQLWKEKQV